MYFLFSFKFTSCISVLWPFDIHCTYLLIYIWWCMFSQLSLHVLFLFSLCTHVSLCTQSLFLFHTKMHWWVLFKVFQKDRLWKSIMPWTLFLQSFSRVCVRVRFFCIPISCYEFSNLRLLSWSICLLWFCHGLPKGDIVRDICYVN